MPNYKEMTQEEASNLWRSGVHTMEYAADFELYVDGEKVPWIPFVPTAYFWDSPAHHWAERWRVETE